MPYAISKWPLKPLSCSLYLGYKGGQRTPVQRQCSLELGHCSNRVSHSNKLYSPLILPHGNSFPTHTWTMTVGTLQNVALLTRVPLFQAPYFCCCCCCLVSKSGLTSFNPMDCSMSGSSVLHYLLEFAQTHVRELVLSNYLILCRPLLLLPSIVPSIRVFSNVSALCITWSKYWGFSFSNIPSNDYSEFVSFRIDWFDLER